MKWFAAIMAMLTVLVPGTAQADPFAALRAAYSSRDANAAAAAYTSDAVVVYRYSSTPAERYQGTRAITGSFAALFDQIDVRDTLDLNFREIYRSDNRVRGFYRLRIGRSQTSYGRYDVVIDKSGKFTSDESSEATRQHFEEASGPLLLAPDDETLDRLYYSRLTGRYRLPDGCTLVVTQSVVRLFMRNSCTNDWRGLSRIAGRSWTGGDTILSQTAKSNVQFAPVEYGPSAWLQITSAAKTIKAIRRDSYRTEDVTFKSSDGMLLSGTVYIPAGTVGRHPASVMIHGSGPQDRNGYASIIAVLADEMAASGRVVLLFDKRGTGESLGDRDRAGFGVLAADATAAMDYLSSRADVDRQLIGFAGSSQAGWVAAKAIADGAKPADVFLLGAAGAALTVADQNIYNTKIQMRCADIAASDIDLALRQQAAFFDFLRDPSAASELDRLTAEARTRPALIDWLFPNSSTTDRSAGAWFVVLDPDFDPLPVWKRYRGNAHFVFSEFDNSTPTLVARGRLKHQSHRVTTMRSAQHLGLLTTDICKDALTDLSKFSPELFKQIQRFSM